MNKYLKITLIVIGVIIGLIAIDTIQAKVFNNSPVLSFKVKIDDKNYVKKGLLVNTYYCHNEKASSKFKFTEYYCLNDYNIEDINNIIINYMENKKDSYNNFVFNYIEDNKVIIGLVDISLDKQDEFMTKVFGEEKNRINKKLIEFKESKEIFDAKVQEVYEDYIIVETLESSSSFLRGDKVRVDISSLSNKNSLEIDKNIEITFNGMVLYSDPDQITALSIKGIE